MPYPGTGQSSMVKDIKIFFWALNLGALVNLYFLGRIICSWLKYKKALTYNKQYAIIR